MTEEAMALRRDYQREWNCQNRDKIREYQREWVCRNRDKVRAYRREWGRQNPDKVREYQQRYWEKRAKVLKAGDGGEAEYV